MTMEIMPHYFMVRINIEEQKRCKERFSKDSVLYMPPSNIGNSRNMECGEIVQIGEWAKNIFEEAKIGDVLIFDWIIESGQDETRLSFFLYSDEEYNYYAVNEPNIKGLYKDGIVIPHKNYIFLKNISAFPPSGELDEVSGLHLDKTQSGLFVFTDYKETPQDIARKVEDLKLQINSLAKSRRTLQVQQAIDNLSKEMNGLNRKLQKKTLLPYKVAYSSKRVDRNFGFKLKEDDILYCENWACRYITNFKNKDYSYIVCPVDNIGFLYKSQGQVFKDKVHAVAFVTH